LGQPDFNYRLDPFGKSVKAIIRRSLEQRFNPFIDDVGKGPDAYQGDKDINNIQGNPKK
jgi:hypothetical protein